MSMGIVDLVGRGLGCERSGIVSFLQTFFTFSTSHANMKLSGQKGWAPGQTPQSGRSGALLYRWLIFDHLVD